MNLCMKLAHHLHLYQPRGNDIYTARINEECYKPLSKNKVLENVSFDIGPTLVDWLYVNDKNTLSKIIRSDKGQAMAQSYNHRLLPLARYDMDVDTQIIWGLKHFEKYFSRKPKGMWLPETATSKRVLEKLTSHGIEYTIGADNQNAKSSDTSKVFEIELPSKKKINYFFYNKLSGPIAHNSEMWQGSDLTYLANADYALEKIVQETKDDFILLAYDGETFGHHHKFADMWIEHFPKSAKKKGFDTVLISSVNGEFKEKGYVWDDSAWSCKCGGLVRWTQGCDCAGAEMDYKKQLLSAAEHQEDLVHEIFDSSAGKLLVDPWDARNDYIDLSLKNLSWQEFISKHFKNKPSRTAQGKVLDLLKAEYHTQLSFTSCGWFFENIHPQTKNNILDMQKAAFFIKRGVGKDISSGVKGVEWMLEHVS